MMAGLSLTIRTVWASRPAHGESSFRRAGSTTLVDFASLQRLVQSLPRAAIRSYVPA
jgi:hypothetical protein